MLATNAQGLRVHRAPAIPSALDRARYSCKGSGAMRRGSVTLRRNSSQNEKAGRDERIRLSNVTYVPRLLRPLGDIDVIAACDAGVALARTADFLCRVPAPLPPLPDPPAR